MMKEKLLKFIIAIMFIMGVSVVLYPTVSSIWNQKNQSEENAEYEDTIHTLTQSKNRKVLMKAQAYNIKLRSLDEPFRNHDLLDGYDDILNISGTGVMGQLTIDKIGVELPIYHGADRSNLEVGVGHLEGSSFPVGGKGTHAVLSAHSGLPQAKLFSELHQLELGDVFNITVLDQTIVYQVDQIKVVEPEEMEDLEIDRGQDYCTLVTCTPIGVNTHRLLVRGVRVDEEAAETWDYESAQPVNVDKASAGFFVVIFAGVSIVSVPIYLVHRRILRIRKKYKIDLQDIR